MYCKVCREPIMLIDQDRRFITCPNCKSVLEVHRSSGIMYFEIHERAKDWEPPTARIRRERDWAIAAAIVLVLVLIVVLYVANEIAKDYYGSGTMIKNWLFRVIE